ncbi:MAG: PPC domain-containing protein [Myxococcales bacterium]|nr:PPC domain-containing protein [Myxococcales bacterium]
MRASILLMIAASLFAGCTQDADDGDNRETPPLVRDARMLPDARPDMAVRDEPDMPEDAPDAVVDAMHLTVDAGPPAACADGEDNDDDGLIDDSDPGCEGPDDDDEVDPILRPQCDDGRDNDGDGLVDAEDPDCLSGSDPTERGDNPATACNNHVDDDEDGFTDFPGDPGCAAAGDDDETDPNPLPACANRVDDDGDGFIDFPNDPDCTGRGDADEEGPDARPACGNGLDDDNNGFTDYPADPGCTSAADRDESNPCGAEVELVDLTAHLAANEAYDGTLADRGAGHLGATCGGRAGGEVAFTWRIDRLVESVTFNTRHPETEAPVVMYVRRACDAVGELACDRGNAMTPGTALTLMRPEPGVYFVVVDTGSRDTQGAFRLTVDTVYPPQCRDGIDNDADGLLDRDDPGCAEFDDDDEVDPELPPVCSNGLDDDGDGLVDYPADEECLTAGYDREQPLCDLPIPWVAVGQAGGRFDLHPEPAAASEAQGTCAPGNTSEAVLVITLDDPSDVAIQTYLGQQQVRTAVFARTDCVNAGTEIGCRNGATDGALLLPGLDRGTYFVLVEQTQAGADQVITAEVVITSNIRQCNDLVDNDGDGRVDLADPGCEEGLDDSEADPPEVPACADGVDNDGDGDIDWPDDADCRGAGGVREAPACNFNPDVIVAPEAGGNIQYDTRGQPSVGRATCGGGGPQAVVSLTLRNAASVTFTIGGTSYDPLIHLRSVCDDANSEIACNDDSNGLDSQISVARLEAGTYFLFLDGFAGGSGTGTLTIAVRPL